jgi:hypothetical protein
MKRNDIRINRAKRYLCDDGFFPPYIVEDMVMNYCTDCSSGHPLGDCIHITECSFTIMERGGFLLPKVLDKIDDGQTIRFFVILKPERPWAPTIEQYADILAE